MATPTSMNISLPESMRRWVEQRIEAEGYGTASEYFRALVRNDQRRRAHEETDRKLVDALEGGAAAELTPKDWQDIRAAVRQRLAAKAKRK